jgi:hypothetical protein
MSTKKAKSDVKDKKDAAVEGKETEEGKETGEGKETEGAAAAAAATGTNNCVQRPAANVLQNLKELPSNVIQKGAEVLNTVRSCGEGFGSAIPNVFNNITKGINDVADSLNNSRQGSGNPVYKAVLLAVDGVQNKIDHMLLGDMADKDIGAAEVLKNFQNMTTKYRDLVTNPKFKEVIGGLGESYVKVIVSAMDATRPSIGQITDKGKEMLEEIGTKAGTTVGTTATNALKSAIATIPVVGGIIDAVLTLGSLSNNLVSTCKPIAQFAADTGFPMINKGLDARDDMRCKILEMQKQADEALAKLDGDDKGDDKGDKDKGEDKDKDKDIKKGGSGGLRRNKKSKSKKNLNLMLQRKIKKTTQRIRRSLRMFTASG